MMLCSHKLLMLIILVLMSFNIWAQVESTFKEHRLDSLEQKLESHRKQDDERLTLLNQLTIGYSKVNPDQGVAYGNQAISLAEKLNKQLLLAEACHNTGLNWTAKSDYPKAMELYEKALALNQSLHNMFGIAYNEFFIGDIARRKGDRKTAFTQFEKTLQIFEEIKNQEGIAKAYNGLGTLYVSDPKKALELFEKALTINKALGTKNEIASNYMGMGKVYFTLSDFPTSLDYYLKSLHLNEEKGNTRIIAYNYVNLGIVYQSMAEYPKAIQSYQHAIRISEQLGDQYGIAAGMGNLGSVHALSGNYPKALESYQKALSICEELNNKDGVAQNVTRMGNIYSHLSDYDKALEFHQKALALHEQLDNKSGMALCFTNIGLLHYNLTEYGKAIEYYQKALSIFEQTGDKNNIANNLLNQGAVHEKLSDYTKAIDYYQRGLHLSEQIGNKSGIAACLGNLGNVYRDAPEHVLRSSGINPGNRFALALQYQLRGLTMARDIGAIAQEKDALENISRTYELQKNFAKAYETFKEYFILRDSLEGAETKQEITRKEMQYEFDKTETELHFQQQLTDEQLAKQQLINKQQQRTLLLGVIAFIGLVGWLITRLWYARKNQQLLQRQKELEQHETERLTELDKLKTNLYTNITHEFRTPLTLILGPVRKLLALSRKASATEIDDNLKLIQNNGQRMLSLVNQILDLQKLEARQLEPHYEQGNVMVLLHYLVDSFHSLAEPKNISLDFYCQPESLLMDFDRDKLQKIFSNLLANAIKFTPTGGAVKVEATRDDQYLEITINDTGVGIPQENLDTIFSLFYQVDNSSTRRQEGTGIGLTLVKDLVELLKGNIAVTSEPGIGSTFTVRLPIRNDAVMEENGSVITFNQFQGSSNAIPVHMEGLNDNHENTPLILVVEDNPDVALYLGSCLDNLYRIEYALNGNEGIQKAIDLIPDIVISDVMMPEADGFEVCRFLKNDARTSHIPVVLLTALAEVKNRMEGLRRGADAYLTKPFYEEELLITIEQLLRLRHILRERYEGLSIPERLSVSSPDEKDSVDQVNFDIPMEDAFMTHILQIIRSHTEDAEFTVEKLTREMGMSNTQLFRKLKALTDLSASQLIRQVRLDKAKELLRGSNLTIAEVAYQTGFTDPSYFTRIFSREVGVTPTEFLK